MASLPTDAVPTNLPSLGGWLIAVKNTRAIAAVLFRDCVAAQTGELDLAHCASELCDEDVVAITHNVVPAVGMLTLNGCTSLSTGAMETIAAKLHGLRVLSLRGCVRIDDGALLALATKCGRLQRLDCSGCPLVSMLCMRTERLMMSITPVVVPWIR